MNHRLSYSFTNEIKLHEFHNHIALASQNLSKPDQLNRIKVLYLKTNRILGQLLETKQRTN